MLYLVVCLFSDIVVIVGQTLYCTIEIFAAKQFDNVITSHFIGFWGINFPLFIILAFYFASEFRLLSS